MKTLNTQEAYDLFKKGRQEWNHWASENENCPVDFTGLEFELSQELNFSGFIFPGGVNFSRSKFNCNKHSEYGYFDGAVFNGPVLFENTMFHSFATFRKAHFHSHVSFYKAELHFHTSFEYAIFEKKATFTGSRFSDKTRGTSFFGAQFEFLFLDHCSFSRVPDLRVATFSKGLSMHQMSVSYSKSISWVTKSLRDIPYESMMGYDDEEKHRRLKVIASEAKDYESEQKYFAQELKAKRIRHPLSPKHLPNYLYQLLSDYGQSIYRPLVWLCFSWILFGFLHKRLSMGSLEEAMIFSFHQIVPLLSSSKLYFSDYDKFIYASWYMPYVLVIENVVGVILIFLFGLALRRRFRM